MEVNTKQNVRKILKELPQGVELVVAAKGRSPREVLEVVEGGVEFIGENYLQDAQKVYPLIGNRVKWHFIGHLQKNKVKKAVGMFDMIETVDSLEIAREVEEECARLGRVMPVLIEINSGKEAQKFGVCPDDAVVVVEEIARLEQVKVMGLMTMGPRFGDPEESRPYFVKTKKIFDKIKDLNLPGVEMRYLSMGMTNSYKVAVEEGASIVRIGSKIFGERKY
ncbi:MAG: YggS family pyridoxal phosphate-dependent enzyme [Dehalococcoidia bacterium]|nr:YggS family pyridoxal phosphate-dependent enzyme [Dehalococcoidia bacterium]